MLDLGIVIVNYNVRDLLRDCLVSVYESRGDFAFQACVVDNGSGDGSADMVEDEFEIFGQRFFSPYRVYLPLLYRAYAAP